jgi:hypothetical protein
MAVSRIMPGRRVAQSSCHTSVLGDTIDHTITNTGTDRATAIAEITAIEVHERVCRPITDTVDDLAAPPSFESVVLLESLESTVSVIMMAI